VFGTLGIWSSNSSSDMLHQGTSMIQYVSLVTDVISQKVANGKE